MNKYLIFLIISLVAKQGLAQETTSDVTKKLGNIFSEEDPYPDPEAIVRSSWIKLSLAGGKDYKGRITEIENTNTLVKHCGNKNRVNINEKPITFFLERESLFKLGFIYQIVIKSNNDGVSAIKASKSLFGPIEIRFININQTCVLEKDPNDDLHFKFVCSDQS